MSNANNEKKIIELLEENTRLLKENKDLQTRLDEAQRRLNYYNIKEFEIIREDNKRLTSTVESLRRDNDRLSRENQDLRLQLQETKEQLYDTQNDLMNIDMDLRTTQTRVSVLETQLNNIGYYNQIHDVYAYIKKTILRRILIKHKQEFNPKFVSKCRDAIELTIKYFLYSADDLLELYKIND